MRFITLVGVLLALTATSAVGQPLTSDETKRLLKDGVGRPPANSYEAVMLGRMISVHQRARVGLPLIDYAICLRDGSIQPDTKPLDGSYRWREPQTPFEAVMLVVYVTLQSGYEVAAPLFEFYADNCWRVGPDRRPEPKEKGE